MAAKNKPNEIYINRLYNAPVKLVWEAWTDPAHVARWWGPRGFTLTTHSKDLRPGGHWKYTMHGPDGTDYENTTIYHEVGKYSRLVYDHGGSEDRPPLFRVDVSFREEKGKTRMEMTFGFASAEIKTEMEKFIRQAGGNSTWDRLAEYLAGETEGKDRFVINRTFQAPLETLFQLWTDPEHLSRWLPPAGFTMEFLEGDIRPGGSSFYSMTNGEMTMYGRARYLEVTRPDRIVYTQEFCDKDGNPSRHPLAPAWPATMLTVVTLEAESANSTRVTVEWEVHGEASQEERDTFHVSKAGMTMGWTGSFDKLENLIKGE